MSFDFCLSWMLLHSVILYHLPSEYKKVTCKLVDEFRTCLMAGLSLRGTVNENETVFHPFKTLIVGKECLMKFCFEIKNGITHPRCIAQDYWYSQLHSYLIFSKCICLYYCILVFVIWHSMQAYVFDVEDEYAESDIPTTLMRSKADCPGIEVSLAAAVVLVIINSCFLNTCWLSEYSFT